MNLRLPSFALLCTAFLASFSAAAQAADTVPIAGVVNLTSTASIELPQDVMTVALAATRDGSDAAAVQAALKQALDAALAEARKVAKPPLLEVKTGNFSLFPRYNPKGGISGWQGTAELLIEGRDMPAIGALVGRIATLNVARVGFALSREQREKVEGEVTAQAVARYRARAAELARLFGYSGYALREINVSGSEGQPMPPAPMMRAMARSAPAEEALPVEAGKAQVAVTVSGSVQLLK